MSKYKILTVAGTRPELIRLSRIIPCLDKCFKHILVYTNQNFDKNLSSIFFDDLKIRNSNYFFKSKNTNSSKLIGSVFEKIEKIIIKEKPDAFFVLGDTNSALAAIIAKKNKIPIFHYEAGNRCYDQNVPEEINRKIVDHISDINITYSDDSKQNLIREGINPEFIFKIGSPMFEVLSFYEQKIKSSKILKKLSLKKEEYIVISTHRQENLDNTKKFFKFIEEIFAISKQVNKKIVFSTHPRVKELIKNSKTGKRKNVFLDPLNFTDYNCLQQNSYLVLSDSGTINEEAAILKFDAINLRDNHERHEAMENTVSIMTGYDDLRIKNAISIIKSTKNNTNLQDYKVKDISSKIVRIIQSYISKINKKIYYKN